jgi:hypothetical protein
LQDVGGDNMVALERAAKRLGNNFNTISLNRLMGLGTKNRQKQTADICKRHLREKYPDKLGLVEEFIVEIEGPPNNCDVTRWGQFTDIKDIKKEMFQRLAIRFENWLNS